MTAFTANEKYDAALLTQLPELSGWQPAISEIEGNVDVRTASMLAALFDQPPLRDGDELPPAWHWAFFVEPALQRNIGVDGHPGKGDFLPPISLPRRMYAGSLIHFHHPLIVGRCYRRIAKVASVDLKKGRSGKLAFVKVQHTIVDARGTPHLTEEQDVVYREPVTAANNSAPAPEEVKAWIWTREFATDPVMLFRYSAATFNGHRIHYDHPYVTREEGYPDLVVHGPLLATLMLEALREKLPHSRVASFRFAAKNPVFVRQKFHAAGKVDSVGRAVELAILNGGQTAMTGQATLRSNSGRGKE